MLFKEGHRSKPLPLSWLTQYRGELCDDHDFVYPNECATSVLHIHLADLQSLSSSATFATLVRRVRYVMHLAELNFEGSIFRRPSLESRIEVIGQDDFVPACKIS